MFLPISWGRNIPDYLIITQGGLWKPLKQKENHGYNTNEAGSRGKSEESALNRP